LDDRTDQISDQFGGRKLSLEERISHRAESDNQGKEKRGVLLAMPTEVEKAKRAMA
jgi:hypothetical protein